MVQKLTRLLDMPFVSCGRLLVVALAIACGRPNDVPAQSENGASSFASSRDPAVQAASVALAAGRPWRATELLDSAFRNATTRTPEVTLVAATAAAAWGGWSRVDRELATALWLDTLFDGRGRELLARAALARGLDSTARAHAELAVRSARTDRDRGVRLVLLARSLDRLAVGDSAAATYLQAARLLPLVADWLHLRAAGALADPTRRQRSYARISTAVARARIQPTEAQARERWRDYNGAARVYAELGQRADALRLRLLAATNDVARGEIRSAAMALLASSPSAADARTAIALVDSLGVPLSAADELIVARAAAAAGMQQRAASGFSRAGSGLEPADRFAYATALSRLGRDADAAREFARVPANAAMGGVAAYQRARSLLRAGQGTPARRELRRVTTAFAGDTASAAPALFLLADLATDDGRDAAARQAFTEVARRYPTSRLAPVALFRAGIILFAANSFDAAAREMEAVAQRYPRSVEATAARYWAGRARDRAGDRQRARERWREVMSSDPLSYYSMLSARRLGAPAWNPQPSSNGLATPVALRTAIHRAELLDVLGMNTEEAFEYDAMVTEASRAPDSLLAAAAALGQRGETSRAIALARRALDTAAPRDTRLFHLLYPVPFADVIRAEAAAHAVDPALVAALIHQESSFNPRAASGAGALGLMQVLPSVGASIARSARVSPFERVLLFQPDVNIRLGTIHLDAMLRQYPDIVYALAAYNAGGSPVRRWRQKAGSSDPELFTERVPYDETRDYVRILLRNQATYKALYSW